MYTGSHSTERNQGQGRERDDQPYMGIREAAPLPAILEGRIRETGEPVVLLQTCDWSGHSPSVVGVRNGQLFIASFDEVIVRDRLARPSESNDSNARLSGR